MPQWGLCDVPLGVTLGMQVLARVTTEVMCFLTDPGQASFHQQGPLLLVITSRGGVGHVSLKLPLRPHLKASH